MDWTVLPPEIWQYILGYLWPPTLLKLATLSSHWYHLSIPVIYESVYWTLDGVDGLSERTEASKMLVNQLRSANEGDTALLSRVRQCTLTSRLVCPYFQSLFDCSNEFVY
jgi:hypothetical protein